MSKPKKIFVSSRYFELLSIAVNDWQDNPRTFTDFGDFLIHLKDALKKNARDTLFDAIVREEVRMQTDPEAFEV